MEVNCIATVNCLVSNIQNILFCAQQKKETHTCVEQLKGV